MSDGVPQQTDPDPNAWRNKRRFESHPEAERFDAVTVTTVERWKESELSGDEWRFSYRATFYSHGRVVASIGAGSVEDALRRAALEFRSIPLPDEWRDQVNELCCQPGCPNEWIVALHPIKAWTRAGEELVREPLPGVVRCFCDRHRHRGDCALDDADHNYVVVEERFPQAWTEASDAE